MSKNILIIEDSKLMLKVMADFFKEKGYLVSEALTGEEGVEAAIAQKPDIVLIDTVLPGIDGFEVCQQIKKDESVNAKLIVMTSEIGAVDALKARKHGADDYAVKTAECEELNEAVESVLGE